MLKNAATLVLLVFSLSVKAYGKDNYGIFVIGGNNPYQNFKEFDDEVQKVRTSFGYSSKNSIFYMNSEVQDKFVQFEANGATIYASDGEPLFTSTDQKVVADLKGKTTLFSAMDGVAAKKKDAFVFFTDHGGLFGGSINHKESLRHEDLVAIARKNPDTKYRFLTDFCQSGVMTGPGALKETQFLSLESWPDGIAQRYQEQLDNTFPSNLCVLATTRENESSISSIGKVSPTELAKTKSLESARVVISSKYNFSTPVLTSDTYMLHVLRKNCPNLKVPPICSISVALKNINSLDLIRQSSALQPQDGLCQSLSAINEAESLLNLNPQASKRLNQLRNRLLTLHVKQKYPQLDKEWWGEMEKVGVYCDDESKTPEEKAKTNASLCQQARERLAIVDKTYQATRTQEKETQEYADLVKAAFSTKDKKFNYLEITNDDRSAFHNADQLREFETKVRANYIKAVKLARQDFDQYMNEKAAGHPLARRWRDLIECEKSNVQIESIKK